MIDPVSAIGMATAAYNGIKTAIAKGKEISEMGTTLASWSRAVSDLDYCHKQAQNPPMLKKMFGASKLEQDALEIWAQKKKADQMREELRSYISLYYGPSSWDEIVRIEAQMRKERKEQAYAAEERKQTIIEWVVGLLMALAMSGIIALIIWVFGKSQGRW